MVRLKHQRHPPAFHFRVALDLAHRPKLGLDLIEDLPSQVDVCHFPAAELEMDLHLVALIEELLGVAQLRDPGTLTITVRPLSPELLPDFLRFGPLSGAWRWRHLPAHVNGQAAVAEGKVTPQRYGRILLRNRGATAD
jgi:hypothetical protein